MKQSRKFQKRKKKKTKKKSGKSKHEKNIRIYQASGMFLQNFKKFALGTVNKLNEKLGKYVYSGKI